MYHALKSRRLSRRLTLLAAPLLALALLLSLAARPAAAGTYTNPRVVGAADPFITYQNGTYYLLGTSLSNDIRIWSSPSLATLGSGGYTSVYNTGSFYESAELYTFNGLWYIYYTQYPNTVQVLESNGSNPLGGYHAKATLTTNTYDATLLQMPGGQLYLLGSTYGTLVIQPLSNPYTTSGGQTTIAHIDQGWESGVIEAPEALWHNGQLNILYTSGGYNQSNYAVGSLHFNGGDPTNAGSYSKLPGPLFTQNPSAGVYDAGVATPFSSPDGRQTYFCYSDYPSQGAPDSQRSILAQPLSFDGNNNPVFGSAIGPGHAIPLPSGDPGNGSRLLVPGDKVSFQALANGEYVCADNEGTSPLIANRTAVGQWETFTVVDAGNGNIGLQSMANGEYVCADNAGSSPLIANRTAVGPWETFTEVDEGGNNVALRAMANGEYVCADNAGASPLIANRTAVCQWETFTVQTH